MDDNINYMNLKEFVDLGFLFECNRQFFHPLGLALEVLIDDNNNAVSLGGIWDYREDPEGACFGDLNEEHQIKADNVKAELEKHKNARIALFGHIIQPIKNRKK